MVKNQALAEATAAAAASLVSMLSSYPVDVIKTNLQANKDTTNKKEKENNKDETIQCYSSKSKMNAIKSLFRGVHFRSMQFIVQYFTYFYIYSTVKSTHRRIAEGKTRGKVKKLYEPSVTVQLLLAAVSAMITVVTTLPLETIATRKQIEIEENKDGSNSADDEIYHSEVIDTSSTDTDITAISSVDSEEPDEATNTCNEKQVVIDMYQSKVRRMFQTDSLESIPQQVIRSSKSTFHSNHKLKDILGLWKGLLPSLLLTSNPAINFTVFDVLKSMLLKHKSKSAKQNSTIGLSVAEAFVIGTIGKFAATVATYPLIRTKMLLIAAKSSEKYRNDDGKDEEEDMSIHGILRSMYRRGGVAELYKGCGLTLLLTLYKTAIFMAVKDKLTY
jgi:hypothetical protein